MILGRTGTGKTTLLNILGKFIPEEERILLIEDTSEIHMIRICGMSPRCTVHCCVRHPMGLLSSWVFKF